MTTSLYGTCRALFGGYRLAVNRHRSMCLMLSGNGEPAFYGLGWDGPDAGFAIWIWGDRAFARITPDSEPPASGEVADILAGAVPLPRDGALTGWQAGGTITTMITTYSQRTPGWAVMPREGTPETSWAPFTGERVLGPWFWDHYRAGNIVDLAPLAAATPGAIFWAFPGSLSYGCCAAARDVTSPDGWTLPAGCYVYYQSLRAGETAGALEEVLAGDVTDLSPRFRAVA